MINSCCFIFLCALLTNTYTADIECEVVRIKHVLGNSAVLECPSSEKENKLQQNVHWRYNDSLNVCDMIEGKCSVEDQDPKYKNRTFPQKSVKGNFPLKLYNLTYNDSGEYRCYIENVSKIVIVHLLVIAPEDGNHTGLETWKIIVIVIVIVIVFGCLAVCIIIWMTRKHLYKIFCSGVSEPVPASFRVLFRRLSNTPEQVNQHQSDPS